MKKTILILISIIIIIISGIVIMKTLNLTKEKGGKSMEKSISIQRKIRMSWDDKEIIATLEKNSTTADFVSQLPITVSFEDFNSTEKIANLNQELSQESEGYTPKTGDLAYYAPWGNISIFYKDFSYSEGLVRMGKVTKGKELIRKLEGKEVTIELIAE